MSTETNWLNYKRYMDIAQQPGHDQSLCGSSMLAKSMSRASHRKCGENEPKALIFKSNKDNEQQNEEHPGTRCGGFVSSLDYKTRRE